MSEIPNDHPVGLGQLSPEGAEALFGCPPAHDNLLPEPAQPIERFTGVLEDASPCPEDPMPLVVFTREDNLTYHMWHMEQEFNISNGILTGLSAAFVGEMLVNKLLRVVEQSLEQFPPDLLSLSGLKRVLIERAVDIGVDTMDTAMAITAALGVVCLVHMTLVGRTLDKMDAVLDTLKQRRSPGGSDSTAD